MSGNGASDGTPGGAAAALMRMALALLDRDGKLLAAARLQHALDTLEDRPRVEED